MSWINSSHDHHQNKRLGDLHARAKAQSNIRRRAKANQKSLEGQVAELKLLCRALIEVLQESGAPAPEIFEQALKRIDAEDGVADGKITPPLRAPKAFKKARKKSGW